MDMIRERKKQKLQRLNAQAMLEYSVFIICVIAALIAMQIYIKRGVEGKLKEVSDDMGEQYAPKNTTATITTHSVSAQTEQSNLEQIALPSVRPMVSTTDTYGLPIYSTNSTTTATETTTRSGREELGRFEDNLFD